MKTIQGFAFLRSDRKALCRLALGGFLGMASLKSFANDWPRFRGADLDNISKETGLLRQWPEGGPKLLWKATGLGAGNSTISIAAGKIYTLGDLPEGASVICLDVKDGGKLWSTPIGRAGANDTNPTHGPGTRSTPTVDGNRVYALGQFGDLVCLESDTGKLVWKKNLRSDFGGQVGGWDYSESPIIDGDKLIVTPGGARGTMAALNKSNGEVIWRSTEWKAPAEYVTPIIATIDGVRQYVQVTKTGVAGIAADDGKLLWTGPIPRHGRSVAFAASPVYADNHVFISVGYGNGCNALKITKTADAFKAEEVYHKNDLQNHHGGLVLLDGHVYGSGDPGFLVCMNLKSGEVAWKERAPKGSITCADGMIILRSERGPVHLVEATPAGFKPLGDFEQPDRTDRQSWPYPVVSDGKLYLRDQGLLLCYDIKK